MCGHLTSKKAELGGQETQPAATLTNTAIAVGTEDPSGGREDQGCTVTAEALRGDGSASALPGPDARAHSPHPGARTTPADSAPSHL